MGMVKYGIRSYVVECMCVRNMELYKFWDGLGIVY